MNEYRLDRDNDVPLVFTGAMLAHVSSRTPGQRRWTELTLYRTDSGRYVVQRVGRSIEENEVDRVMVNVVDDALAVRKVLQRNGEHGPYLTYLALDLLEAASLRDSNFLLEERI